MIADSVEELHWFAEGLGLKRHSFNSTKKGHPYYNLTNDRIKAKLQPYLDSEYPNVKKVTSRWIVKFFNNIPHRAMNT